MLFSRSVLLAAIVAIPQVRACSVNGNTNSVAGQYTITDGSLVCHAKSPSNPSDCDGATIQGCQTVTCETRTCIGSTITVLDGGTVHCGAPLPTLTEHACVDATIEAYEVFCRDHNSLDSIASCGRSLNPGATGSFITAECMTCDGSSCGPSSCQWNGNPCPNSHSGQTCATIPPPEWGIDLQDATATFEDNGQPEITVTYKGAAPSGTDKYYTQRIMLSDCVTSAASTEIGPKDPTVVDESQYDPTGYNLAVYVDIDTTNIQASPYWTSSGAGLGTIEFCLRMDLNNEDGLGVGMEASRITLQVDMTESFDILSIDATPEAITTGGGNIFLNYPMTTEFCDDSNQPITPTPSFFPGESIQFCVSTPSPDAVVTDVWSVAFKNSNVPGLSISLIDGAGTAANQQTTKTCGSGICRVKTVAYSSLFDYDTDNDGVLEDVSDGVSIEGTAVLEFARRRQLEDAHKNIRYRLEVDVMTDNTKPRILEQNGVTDFGIEVDLVRREEDSSGTAPSVAWWWTFVMVVLAFAY